MPSKQPSNFAVGNDATIKMQWKNIHINDERIESFNTNRNKYNDGRINCRTNPYLVTKNVTFHVGLLRCRDANPGLYFLFDLGVNEKISGWM